MRLMRGALLLCALFGCAEPRAPESPSSGQHTQVDPNEPRGDALHTPMFSRLVGPKLPRAHVPLELELAIDRRIPLSAEVQVTLRMPAGVSLTQGHAAQRLAGNRKARQDALKFAFALAELPHGDLTVVVDARGPGFGYHAEHPYRFGRAAPLPTPPVRGERVVRVAGKSFGRSVPVSSR
jgi:hypothetical protein